LDPEALDLVCVGSLAQLGFRLAVSAFGGSGRDPTDVAAAQLEWWTVRANAGSRGSARCECAKREKATTLSGLMTGGSTKSVRRWPACVLAATALGASAPAAAQVPGDAVRADPMTAGAGSHLLTDLRVSDDPKAGGQSPRQAFINVAAGFKYDGRARSETCSQQRAAGFDCPGNSKIGTGTANVTLVDNVGALAPQPLVADVELFLAPPQQAGDPAGVVMQVRERGSGQRATTTGRVVKVGAPYGLGLRFENLDALGAGAPEGFRIRVDRVQTEVGASRTVKKKAYRYVRRNGKKKRVAYYRKVRYHLIRNPRTCSDGGWPYSITLVYPNGAESVREGTMACAS
jgi:hypothetical protein